MGQSPLYGSWLSPAVCVSFLLKELLTLTGVGPEVSCEGVPSPACIATEGTFERLLSRVQLYVSQKIALLSERGAALVTVERPLTCGREQGGERSGRSCTSDQLAIYC